MSRTAIVLGRLTAEAAKGVAISGLIVLVAIPFGVSAASGVLGFLLLTPDFVPRDLLTRPMEVAATFDPVTYIMEALRSLILEDLAWAAVGRGFAVVAVFGVVMVALSVRMIRTYD